MAFIIPTFPDLANYSISPSLDGTIYKLTFRLSEREGCYYVDLAANDGTPLVSGKKVVCNVSLWKRHRYNLAVPQGHLAVWPAKGQSDDPPNLGELGPSRRCVLFYATAAEVGF